MSALPGSYCGGVRVLEDVRLRCVINDVTDCWRLRKADGGALPTNRAHQLWYRPLEKHLSVPRLVWMLAHPSKQLGTRRVWRCCQSYDCANPAHMQAGTPQEEKAWRHAQGLTASTPAHRAAAKRWGSARSVLTPELREWLVESTQAHPDAAHGLGICRKRAAQLRTRSRHMAAAAQPGSVFDFAARALLDARRAA